MTRFAIVGTGRISDWVLKGAIQDPRFRVSAVCSRTENNAKAFISAHDSICSDAEIFTSIEECAQSDKVDAVYIGTPSSTHFEYAMACIEAGKHVLCEKPMACNARQLQEMADAAKRKGVLIMEAMVSTLNPNFIAARAKLPEIGAIHKCYSTYCQYSTKYDALLKGKVSNSFDPAMGGGALEDIGIYTIYPLVALFGAPDSVTGSLQYIDTPKGKVDTEGSAILRFGQTTASVSWSKAVDAHQQCEFCGEKGNVILDEIHICRSARFIPHVQPSGGRGPKASASIISEGLDHDTYYYEFKEFMDTLDNGETESATNSPDVSLKCRLVMDELHRSASFAEKLPLE